MARYKAEVKKKKTIFPKRTAETILLFVMALVAIAFLAMMVVVDAFPVKMAMTFIVVLLALIVLVWFLLCRDKKAWRIVGIVLAAIYILVYSLGVYYLATTYSMFSRISVDESEAATAAKQVDVVSKPFNLYITGIDQWDSEKGYDLERSDVNMIVTVSPQTRKILLTSIPRDTYIALHTSGQMDKLTHTGVYGVDETIYSVEEWLGIDLNYYVKANFSAVVDVINAMGGVDVYSDREFRPVKRDWWLCKKGWNHMNGKQALAFARERKAYEGEDSQRVENQQKVVKAMLDKLLTSSTLLTSYGDILDAAGDSMETNMPVEDMQALIKMQLADLGTWEIETQKVMGEYDMDYVASLTQEQKFLVYKADPTSLSEVLSNISGTMSPNAAEVAAATAAKQKNSVFSFFKGIFAKDNGKEEE